MTGAGLEYGIWERGKEASKDIAKSPTACRNALIIKFRVQRVKFRVVGKLIVISLKVYVCSS